jgi:hypothetical protein
MRICRAAFSLVALGVGIGLLVSHAVEHPLALAVLLVGVFAAAHLLLERTWSTLPEVEASNGAVGSELAGAFRDTATIYISTPGVVLGLLAVFGDHLRRTTLHVASIALAVTILAGIVLHGLLVYGTPDDEARLSMLGYLFNLLLWSLALGTLCVALAIVFS